MTANSAAIWMRGGLAAPPAGGDDPVADARAIPSSEGTTAGVALSGPDGLVSVPGSDDEIVVVENGGCTAATPRVVRVTLDLG
jgi:hypothetical protein